jgi:hypothetical protein
MAAHSSAGNYLALNFCQGLVLQRRSLETDTVGPRHAARTYRRVMSASNGCSACRRSFNSPNETGSRHLEDCAGLSQSCRVPRHAGCARADWTCYVPGRDEAATQFLRPTSCREISYERISNPDVAVMCLVVPERECTSVPLGTAPPVLPARHVNSTV